jgi:Sulfotransferase family
VPVFVHGEHRVLFVHVPKTGGSAVEDAFSDAGWDVHFLDRRARRHPVSQLRRCSPQHMHAALLDQVLRLDRMDAVLTVVRDPLARFRSEYLWRHRRDPDLDPLAVEAWGRRRLERYAVDPFVRDNHIRPQAEFLLPGARVHRYEDGLQTAVDDLGGVEGLPPPPRVAPAPGEGAHRSADVPLTATLEALLRAFYREDFERFGYG